MTTTTTTGPTLTLSLYPNWLRLFGAVFAAIGALFVVLVLFTSVVTTEDGRPAGPANVPVPAVFLAFGLGLMLARERTVLDRATGELRSERGWGPFVGVKRWRLAQIERVELEIVRSEHRGTRSSYFVALRGTGLQRKVIWGTDEAKTRAQARELARWLGKPFEG
ncbi:MAG: hypothetical protein AAF772_01810 [Acidobacteriota bacterium]